jgi:transcriptional regulator with XRE-family HTH domain
MTLYERIRELRIEEGMTQDDLAHAMGYKDRSMITKIESGKVDISQKKVDAFAKVLNTSPAYLMGWTDDKRTTRERIAAVFEEASGKINQPITPEARMLAKGMDQMPETLRKAILTTLEYQYPTFFKEGNENDDT